MSYAGSKWAYSVEGISASEKSVLAYLGHRMRDSNNQAWPKQSTVAKETGLGLRTVNRAIKSLDEKGLITLVQTRPYCKVFRLELRLTCVPATPLCPTSYANGAYLYKNGQGRDIELSDKSQEEDRGKAIDIGDKFKVIKDDLTPETLLKDCRAEIAKREKVTPGVIVKYYRALFAKEYPDNFQIEFTMKQLGYFTQMIKKAGHDLPLVISVVIPNWIRFTKLVEEKEGLSGRLTPLEPTLPFLLKHIGHGVTFSRAHVCKTTREEARAISRRALTRKPTAEAPKRKTLTGQAGIDVLCGKK